MSKHRGWIALHRKIQDHFLWREEREFSKAEAWIDILMEAQHSEQPQDVVLGMIVLQCHYGQSLKAVGTWAERWNWSPSKVRRFFKLLTRRKMIETTGEGKTTRLTVLNYGRYDPKRRDNDERTENKRRASSAQTATDKNGNNGNQGKNEISLSEKAIELAQFLGGRIRECNPDFKPPDDITGWAGVIEEMMLRDNREAEQIRRVIEYAQQHSFWRTRTMNTVNLRKHFATLAGQLAEGTAKLPPCRGCGGPAMGTAIDDAGQKYGWCAQCQPQRARRHRDKQESAA